MKLLLSTLLAGSVFALTTPALAASDADYRVYCQDDEYYQRHEGFCSRLQRDDQDRPSAYNRSSYDGDDGYSSGHPVRNSNYNQNRTYLPGYSSRDKHNTDGGDRNLSDEVRDEGPYGESAVPGRTQGNTGGLGQGNDSNSYTGQRSTTH